MTLTLHQFAPLLRPAPAAGAQRAADLWWLDPRVMLLMGILPVYLSILAFDFSRVVQNVYVPSGYFAFGVLLIVALAVGVQWALSHRESRPAMVPPRISLGVMMVLLIPTLGAYALWFGPLVAQPQLLMEIALGQRREVRDAISTMPGVTTFTQFGVAYAIAYAIKSGAEAQRLHVVERIGFVLVIALAVFRAYAWAERLAVIEILMCFAVARLAYLPLTSRRSLRLANVAPAIAPLVLYLLFTASEYFRTWDFYSQQYSSVWAFTLDRLIAYYATAVNNGIGMLVETSGWPHYSGAFVVDWLYIMPGVAKLFEGAFGNPQDLTSLFLDRFLRPEFNSPTAYFRLVLDMGFLGSVLLCLGIGYVIGRAYLGFRRGHIFGLLAFPVLVLFLVESLRYSYLGESRFVPLALGLMILGLHMRRGRLAA